MDYRKTAQEILGYVGGSKNIVSAAHCATRLRLVIADNSKADKEAIENVDGVKGVFESVSFSHSQRLRKCGHFFLRRDMNFWKKIWSVKMENIIL